MKTLLFFLLGLIISITNVHCLHSEKYVKSTAKKGDGINRLLQRNLLPVNKFYIDLFINLNKDESGKKSRIFLGKSYLIPVRIFIYNGRTIRSTIGIKDYETAKKIQDYNDSLKIVGVRKDNFRKSRELRIPIGWLPDSVLNKIPKEAEPDPIQGLNYAKDKPFGDIYPIFGKYAKTIKKSDKLKGRIFYLVSGHGGPDPGAIGKKNGNELCEDEYAYDITLRLGKRLIEEGALVYIIIRDPDDGIRDESYLTCDEDEIYFDNHKIVLGQLQRLSKRAEIINKYYRKNKRFAKSQHVLIFHVDSRSVGKRIDIFFYYNEGSKRGQYLAESLQKTINAKYNEAQPGRGYEGEVSSRNLYMLRKTHPPAVYFELGNIKNPNDQIRFTKTSNRQAIAEWICDGIIEALEK